MDCIVHGISKSRTQLSDFDFHFHFPCLHLGHPGVISGDNALPGTVIQSLQPQGGNNTVVSCHSLLQGIFPTQGSNPGLLHYRQVFFFFFNHLRH